VYIPAKLQREVFLNAVEEFLSRVQLYVEVRCPWRSNLIEKKYYLLLPKMIRKYVKAT
jgi:hypothetical protein